MKVLQVFHRYLDHSSNWAYRLIRDVEFEHLTIASAIFINSEYLLPGAKLIKPLLSITPKDDETLIVRFIRKLNQRYINWQIKRASSEFEIIHTHFAPTGCEYMKLAKRLKKKLVISFYGYDYEFLPFTQPIFRKRYEELFQFGDAFIAEGPHGASTLKKLGCPDHKIYIVPLGVDISRISKQTRSKPSYSLKLVQVSNYKKKKGHEFTIKAFASALNKCPNISLTLVGKGEERPYIESIVSSLGISDRVNFIDQVLPSKLYDFLTEFDILIQPSLMTADKDTEGGAPVIIIDAQACGLPVISTTHADIPNVCAHQKTGLLSDEGDIVAIQKNICSFYEMATHQYEEYSQNAISYVTDHFDSQKCGKKLKQVYKKIMLTNTSE